MADRWLAGQAGPPVLYRHQACGQISHVDLRCAHCGQLVHAGDGELPAGPSACHEPSGKSPKRILLRDGGEASRAATVKGDVRCFGLSLVRTAVMMRGVPAESVRVNGLQMAYQAAGSGDPIVLLHGNPTSSYLWRAVLPRLADAGRVVALDLIGMGASDKLAVSGPNAYRFVDHRAYLEGALEALGIGPGVVLVGHDWGGALAFDWAYRHPEDIRGLAYMETIVRPRSWAEESDQGRRMFEALRSDAGEQMVLEDNFFVEKVLAEAVLGGLSADDLAAYREPFREPGEDRRPMLTWPREIPFDGQPADVAEIVSAYSQWLQTSQVPKLFVNAEPGALITGDTEELCRSFPNQREVTVVASHFVPEDAPDALADALVDWLKELPIWG